VFDGVGQGQALGAQGLKGSGHAAASKRKGTNGRPVGLKRVQVGTGGQKGLFGSWGQEQGQVSM
jgi:hypothetical protein